MLGSGAINAEKGVSFTIGDFLEAGRERLCLKVVVGGEGLARTVEEPIVNRPGLALTGFFKSFAWRRLQLVGNAESAYLSSLPGGEAAERFAALLAHKAGFFVFTGRHMPDAKMVELAAKHGAVILATPLKTRVFARLATFEMERLSAPRTTLYGTMIEVCGLGILLEGAAGLGKSECALGLVKRGSALVADDLTCIRRDLSTDLLFGSASDATRGYMEIRGIGIIHVPSVFGIAAVRGEKRLQLVVTLKRFSDINGEIDRIGSERKVRSILGVDVPNIIRPVSEGRDMVNLVETAAQQERLLNAGYDVVANLSQRLRGRAEKAKSMERNGKQ